jgi:hypothetical protein
MSDQDRGAYTPQSDAPLAFDARRTPGGGGGRPVPMTLLISGMVLVILIIAIAFFYRSGVRSTNTAPQVVGAPLASTKAPPPASDQPADPAAGLQVYKSEVSPASEAPPPTKLAPAPEQPAPRPAPHVAAPVTSDLAPAPTTPAASVKPAPVKLATAKPVKPLKPVVATPTTSAEHAAESEGVPTTHAAASNAVVQIGAFSSPALADKGWADTRALEPDSMAGKTKKVESVTKDGKVFYRTFVGGFASKDDAAAFCASLKAAGKVCFVK